MSALFIIEDRTSDRKGLRKLLWQEATGFILNVCANAWVDVCGICANIVLLVAQLSCQSDSLELLGGWLNSFGNPLPPTPLSGVELRRAVFNHFCNFLKPTISHTLHPIQNVTDQLRRAEKRARVCTSFALFLILNPTTSDNLHTNTPVQHHECLPQKMCTMFKHIHLLSLYDDQHLTHLPCHLQAWSFRASRNTFDLKCGQTTCTN